MAVVMMISSYTSFFLLFLTGIAPPRHLVRAQQRILVPHTAPTSSLDPPHPPHRRRRRFMLAPSSSPLSISDESSAISRRGAARPLTPSDPSTIASSGRRFSDRSITAAPSADSWMDARTTNSDGSAPVTGHAQRRGVDRRVPTSPPPSSRTQPGEDLQLPNSRSADDDGPSTPSVAVTISPIGPLSAEISSASTSGEQRSSMDNGGASSPTRPPLQVCLPANDQERPAAKRGLIEWRWASIHPQQHDVRVTRVEELICATVPPTASSRSQLLHVHLFSGGRVTVAAKWMSEEVRVPLSCAVLLKVDRSTGSMTAVERWCNTMDAEMDKHMGSGRLLHIHFRTKLLPGHSYAVVYVGLQSQVDEMQSGHAVQWMDGIAFATPRTRLRDCRIIASSAHSIFLHWRLDGEPSGVRVRLLPLSSDVGEVQELESMRNPFEIRSLAPGQLYLVLVSPGQLPAPTPPSPSSPAGVRRGMKCALPLIVDDRTETAIFACTSPGGSTLSMLPRTPVEEDASERVMAILAAAPFEHVALIPSSAKLHDLIHTFYPRSTQVEKMELQVVQRGRPISVRRGRGDRRCRFAASAHVGEEEDAPRCTTEMSVLPGHSEHVRMEYHVEMKVVARPSTTMEDFMATEVATSLVKEVLLQKSDSVSYNWHVLPTYHVLQVPGLQVVEVSGHHAVLQWMGTCSRYDVVVEDLASATEIHRCVVIGVAVRHDEHRSLHWHDASTRVDHLLPSRKYAISLYSHDAAGTFNDEDCLASMDIETTAETEDVCAPSVHQQADDVALPSPAVDSMLMHVFDGFLRIYIFPDALPNKFSCADLVLEVSLNAAPFQPYHTHMMEEMAVVEVVLPDNSLEEVHVAMRWMHNAPDASESPPRLISEVRNHCCRVARPITGFTATNISSTEVCLQWDVPTSARPGDDVELTIIRAALLTEEPDFFSETAPMADGENARTACSLSYGATPLMDEWMALLGQRHHLKNNKNNNNNKVCGCNDGDAHSSVMYRYLLADLHKAGCQVRGLMANTLYTATLRSPAWGSYVGTLRVLTAPDVSEAARAPVLTALDAACHEVNAEPTLMPTAAAVAARVAGRLLSHKRCWLVAQINDANEPLPPAVARCCRNIPPASGLVDVDGLVQRVDALVPAQHGALVTVMSTASRHIHVDLTEEPQITNSDYSLRIVRSQRIHHLDLVEELHHCPHSPLLMHHHLLLRPRLVELSMEGCTLTWRSSSNNFGMLYRFGQHGPTQRLQVHRSGDDDDDDSVQDSSQRVARVRWTQDDANASICFFFIKSADDCSNSLRLALCIPPSSSPPLFLDGDGEELLLRMEHVDESRWPLDLLSLTWSLARRSTKDEGTSLTHLPCTPEIVAGVDHLALPRCGDESWRFGVQQRVDVSPRNIHDPRWITYMNELTTTSSPTLLCNSIPPLWLSVGLRFSKPMNPQCCPCRCIARHLHVKRVHVESGSPTSSGDALPLRLRWSWDPMEQSFGSISFVERCPITVRCAPHEEAEDPSPSHHPSHHHLVSKGGTVMDLPDAQRGCIYCVNLMHFRCILCMSARRIREHAFVFATPPPPPTEVRVSVDALSPRQSRLVLHLPGVQQRGSCVLLTHYAVLTPSVDGEERWAGWRAEEFLHAGVYKEGAGGVWRNTGATTMVVEAVLELRQHYIIAFFTAARARENERCEAYSIPVLYAVAPSTDL